MSEFNYDTEAELFPSKRRLSRRNGVGYRKFDRAADAIQFAVEELPAEFLSGTHLLVDDERFVGAKIRDLYENEQYPLPRRLAAVS